MIAVRFQGKPFNITVIQDYAPTTNAEDATVEWFYEDPQDLLKLTMKKNVLFTIEDWNAKVGSQEIPGVIDEFGLGEQKWGRAKANRVLSRECTDHIKDSSNNTRDDSTHGRHQMVNIKIRLIIFFAAKDGEALNSQQKQDRIWLWLRSWTPYCIIQT